MELSRAGPRCSKMGTWCRCKRLQRKSCPRFKSLISLFGLFFEAKQNKTKQNKKGGERGGGGLNIHVLWLDSELHLPGGERAAVDAGVLGKVAHDHEDGPAGGDQVGNLHQRGHPTGLIVDDKEEQLRILLCPLLNLHQILRPVIHLKPKCRNHEPRKRNLTHQQHLWIVEGHVCLLQAWNGDVLPPRGRVARSAQKHLRSSASVSIPFLCLFPSPPSFLLLLLLLLLFSFACSNLEVGRREQRPRDGGIRLDGGAEQRDLQLAGQQGKLPERHPIAVPPRIVAP
jgi:hypothetical protein